jgi:hypothetical protein
MAGPFTTYLQQLQYTSLTQQLGYGMNNVESELTKCFGEYRDAIHSPEREKAKNNLRPCVHIIQKGFKPVYQRTGGSCLMKNQRSKISCQGPFN